MSWLQFRLETRAELVPRCEEALLALGAAAVTLEDSADEPLFAQPQRAEIIWQHTRITGLFPADTDVDSLWHALPDALREACRYRAEILEDKDWEREWMRNYQPRQFADRLWLCPSWHTPPDPAAVNVVLDPGLAFGTGTHPTTAMCLEHLAGMALQGLKIIDFGCGSGILALASLKLGAARAIATDIDPQALIATEANGRRNGIDPARLRVCLPQDLGGDEQADLVIANILAGPLCDLAGQLCEMLKPQARLLLSGVLVEQLPLLQQRYPIPIEVIGESEGWALLEGRRRE
jgi:ribosomal protein L11 methyltransferase